MPAASSTALRLAFASLLAFGCTRPVTPVATDEGPELKSISISVSTANASLPVGAHLVISAVGIYADGSRRDLTSKLAWRTSDPSLLQVVASADGRVEVLAENAGVAIVQGFLGNDSGAIPVHVTGG